MLKECISVFENMLSQESIRLILDTYVPADGTYIIVKPDGDIKSITNIKKDKKTKELISDNHDELSDIRFYDYYSQLISMNKPMDGKKVVHSNNIYSFAVKKESVLTKKLTEEIINGYYDVLQDPMGKKYQKSKEASRIYQLFEEKEGSVNQELVERHRTWIVKNIFQLDDVDLEEKTYLKIYFEADEMDYEREGRRYFLPNIYNSNDYNVEIESQVYGIPDNNLGMNAKKPFLSIKTRKHAAPYLLNQDEVFVQKQFFDYLMNLVSAGKYHIYIDTERNKILGCETGNAPERMESGYYLRIAKGKNEAEIHDQDNISGYMRNLKRSFQYKNYLNRHNLYSTEYEKKCKFYNDRVEVSGLLDEMFFAKWLKGNYTTDPKDIKCKDEQLKQSILQSRKVIFDWTYKGIDRGIWTVLQNCFKKAILSSIENDYRERAIWQIQLMWSLEEYFSNEGGKTMGNVMLAVKESVENKINTDQVSYLENDDEYCFAVGQLLKYLFSLSKAKEKPLSLINPFLNAKTEEQLKRKIMQLVKKYDYRIVSGYKRTSNLLQMVSSYQLQGKVKQDIVLFGYLYDSLIFAGTEKKQANEDEVK